MTLTATATIFESTQPSYLKFGAGSLLLHLGILMVLGFVHIQDHIKTEPPIVKVTLVETSTPEPIQEESLAEPPPMKATLRPPTNTTVTSRPMAKLSAPSLSTLPTAILTPHSIPLESPKTFDHIQRPILQDRLATDALQLRHHLKTTQRQTSRTNFSSSTPIPLDFSIFASSAMPNVHPPQTMEPTASPVAPSFSQPRPLLRAKPTASHGISKSKVGLGRTIPPVYPRVARESGWEGMVLVRVVIQPDGIPETVNVRRSSGHKILDDAAVEAVKTWQFIPAKDGNIPVRSIVEIPINFDLRQQG